VIKSWDFFREKKKKKKKNAHRIKKQITSSLTEGGNGNQRCSKKKRPLPEGGRGVAVKGST